MVVLPACPPPGACLFKPHRRRLRFLPLTCPNPSGPVLPPALLQFQCHCEKIWYSVVRCRVVDAQGMPLPTPW